tara:strand:+ start:22758 stop:23141 length:384 start_codon:yes stop_codon:yes gene_type:complete
VVPTLVEERKADDGAGAVLHHVALDVAVVQPAARREKVLIGSFDVVARMPIGVATGRLVVLAITLSVVARAPLVVLARTHRPCEGCEESHPPWERQQEARQRLPVAESPSSPVLGQQRRKQEETMRD